MKKMEDYVRSIPDFPEKGIIFRDVTSVLQDADGLNMAIDKMQEFLKDVEFDAVVGLESRGFQSIGNFQCLFSGPSMGLNNLNIRSAYVFPMLFK
jgi:hypothetical protein